MSREEFSLIIVRLIGLYFLAKSLVYAASCAMTALSLSKLNEISENTASLQDEVQISIAQNWAELTTDIATTVCMVILACYFLFYGASIQKLLLYKRSDSNET